MKIFGRIAAVAFFGALVCAGEAQAQRSVEERTPDRSQSVEVPVPLAQPPASTSSRPKFRPEMMDMGACTCDFWAFGCWFDCIFAQGGGSTSTGGGILTPCQQCKRDADNAYRGCLRQAALLGVNTMAYHDAFVECQTHQRDAYIDCSNPDGGTCNDV